MLLVEYRLLDKVKIISESTSNGSKKFKVRGKFQKCDEQNNNGRIYPKKILESQVKELQGKIDERSLVGALDHPPNDAIHLSQASHLITKLWVESNGDVMGEAEILSTPSGKIVEALLNDKVKIGISSRGLGTISEGKNGKIVNEDFKLITFDLVSDPSTKGAFPELTESLKLNSEKAQKIISKVRQDQILVASLSRKIDEAISRSQKRRLSGQSLDEGAVKQANKAKKKDWEIAGFKGDKAKALAQSRNYEFSGSEDKTTDPGTNRNRKYLHSFKRGVTKKIKRSQEVDEAALDSGKERFEEKRDEVDRIKDYRAKNEQPVKYKKNVSKEPIKAEVNPNFKPKSELAKNLVKKLDAARQSEEASKKPKTPKQGKFKFAESIAKILSDKFRK